MLVKRITHKITKQATNGASMWGLNVMDKNGKFDLKCHSENGRERRNGYFFFQEVSKNIYWGRFSLDIPCFEPRGGFSGFFFLSLFVCLLSFLYPIFCFKTVWQTGNTSRLLLFCCSPIYNMPHVILLANIKINLTLCPLGCLSKSSKRVIILH